MLSAAARPAPGKRRILLFYNSPKAKRYFAALRAHLTEYELILAPVGVHFGSHLEKDKCQCISGYTMRRKHAREHIPEWRLRIHQALHDTVAGWHYADTQALIRRHAPDAIGVWGGQSVDVRAAREAAEDSKIPCYTFECGLLPNTTTCDPKGVNFDNSVPRDPAFYRNYPHRTTLPETLIQRAGKRDRVEPTDLPQPYFFVPFQVKLDSQVLLYSPWIRSMDHLYTVMVEAWRDAFNGADVALVFKRHPSCKQSYRHLREAADATPGIVFADGNNTQELIDNALGVLTVNSSVGLEAILRNRPVLAVGDACYGVPGIADNARSVAAVSAWMRSVAEGQTPSTELREPFLHYLAHDYCIPQAHKGPGPEHFAAIARRFSESEYLVPARVG